MAEECSRLIASFIQSLKTSPAGGLQFKKEKTDSLDQEVLQLEKERTYLEDRHNAKLAEIDKKLDELKFHSNLPWIRTL